MFLDLELWEEEPRHDGLPFIIGRRVGSTLNMKAMKKMVFPVNIYSIVMFEHIPIQTVGRPGTDDNKGDIINGVRIQLSDGTQRVVIDSKDVTFEQLIEQAKASSSAVVEVGRSKYMEQFSRP